MGHKVSLVSNREENLKHRFSTPFSKLPVTDRKTPIENVQKLTDEVTEAKFQGVKNNFRKPMNGKRLSSYSRTMGGKRHVLNLKTFNQDKAAFNPKCL